MKLITTKGYERGRFLIWEFFPSFFWWIMTMRLLTWDRCHSYPYYKNKKYNWWINTLEEV